MLTLYDFDNSVCCQKVRITLREKGLDWQAIRINLFANKQYAPDYLKLNPKGVVPTLVHNGLPIVESTLICEYIDETFPNPPLMPKDPAGRARARSWSKTVDEGLFVGVGALSFSAMFRERMRTMPPEMREKRLQNIGDPQRRDRFTSLYEHGVQSPIVLHAVAAYESAFKTLEKTNAEGGPWILGARPTLADISLMPMVARLDYMQLLDVWTADRPHVRAWWAQAQAWPSFRIGLADLIPAPEIAEMQQYGLPIRDQVASRRAEVLRELDLAAKAQASRGEGE